MGTSALGGCTTCSPHGDSLDWEPSGRPTKIATTSSRKGPSGWVLPQQVLEDATRHKSNRPILESTVKPCPSPHVLKRTIDEGFELFAASAHARELLHAAATGCDVAAQRVMLQGGSTESVWQRSCDQAGETALLLAARGGHRSIATLLISRLADLNWRNQNGETALHIACDQGHAEIVDLLVRSGADPRLGESSSNEVPGLWAVRRHAKLWQENKAALKSKPHTFERRESCIELCLCKMEQLDPHVPPATSFVNSMGVTSLHIVAEASDIDLCNLLLQYKAFVEARESLEGASPLMWALRAGATLDMVKLLLRALADPRGRDRHKGTPLHFAVALGDSGLYHGGLLLRAQADVDALDEKGASALALAALRGSPTFIRELLSAGACPRVCSEIMPLLATDNKDQDACRRILESVM